MKKAVSLFLVFIILLGMSFTVNAADVSVYINGEKIEFDVPDINLHEIYRGTPIIFDNLYINTSEILTIEVKEI